MSTIPDPTVDGNDGPDARFGDDTSRVDLREQLVNDCAVGKIYDVQLSVERIVRLHGVLYDLDPHVFRAGGLLPAVPLAPDEFFAAIVRPWLERTYVLSRAEVRITGRGLHVIVRFSSPVEIQTDQDRKRWLGIVKVLQTALPIDPDQPHITALTRPIGSINSKNGAAVRLLRCGEQVPIGDVIEFYEAICSSPFKTLLRTLTGGERLAPCPVCNKQGTRLVALDFAGNCYGSCGKVQLAQLYNLVLAPRNTSTGGQVNEPKIN